MRGFEIVRPDTLEHAIELLANGDQSVRPLSGGTALMQMIKTGMFVPECLVSLAGLSKDHSGIAVDETGEMHIGAMATLSKLERDLLVAEHAPVVAKAMKRLANVRVRNVATVGGALSHGDPHMDLPPIFAALDARAVLQGPSGRREVAVADLYVGYYETILGAGELVTKVIIPPTDGAVCIYRKTTSRTADDWPMVGVAVALGVSEGEVFHARVVLSAATSKLERVKAAEEVLIGKPAGPAVFEAAAYAAAAECNVINDAHGSAEYKTALVGIEVRRALQQAYGGEATE